jgi:hypothetical protein
MMTRLPAHSDNTLNLLRLAAFGVMGLYLYKVHKKQGNFSGFHAANPNWQPSPEAIVDSVVPWLDLHPEHKQILALAGKNLLRGIFEEKGITK